MHDLYTHDDGTKCIFVSGEWFVPLDAGGEGYACEKPHYVSNLDMLASYRRGIADFVSKMSADYRKHNSVAVHEDMLAAIAFFDVEASEFYDDEGDQKVVQLQAEIYKLTGKVCE